MQNKISAAADVIIVSFMCGWHSATSQKIADLIPAGFTGIFH